MIQGTSNRHRFAFSGPVNVDELAEEYKWRRIRRFARRTSFLFRRSMWMTSVGGSGVIKRAMDVSGALLLLLLSSPLLVLVAVAIKISDRGPILFWQNRVGLRGRIFRFPKFRSMVPDADKIIFSVAEYNHHGNSITFKMKRDPRVTLIGRIIRRFSIDELPQLWCVLRGDMALVGPRPALPREVSKYRLAQRRRLDVKPGLTCTWQVRGRADLPFCRQLELDVEYIESRTIWLDLTLLLMTVPAVLSGRGAY
jgi:lipopolysaccharide/colanic/teichoic acid biosynthesis glycosyltransferase